MYDTPRPEEKERLRCERQNYVARTWYQVGREGEARKRKERRHNNQRTCCPSKQLGKQRGPMKKAVTLWLTKCNVCHRMAYCKLRFDACERPGVFFRGMWFQDIDTEQGTATTFQGQEISLTDV